MRNSCGTHRMHEKKSKIKKERPLILRYDN